MNTDKQKLQNLMTSISDARWQFEMAVEATCLEITDIAKQISPAIGDISIDEAQDAIIREFIKRLKS